MHVWPRCNPSTSSTRCAILPSNNSIPFFLQKPRSLDSPSQSDELLIPRDRARAGSYRSTTSIHRRFMIPESASRSTTMLPSSGVPNTIPATCPSLFLLASRSPSGPAIECVGLNDSDVYDARYHTKEATCRNISTGRSLPCISHLLSGK